MIEEYLPDASTIDKGRQMAADTLDQSAAKLRNKAGEFMPGQLGNLAEQAAEKMSSTADYVRWHQVGEMAADLTKLVRRHPTETLVTALVVGVLLGRTMRR